MNVTRILMPAEWVYARDWYAGEGRYELEPIVAERLGHSWSHDLDVLKFEAAMLRALGFEWHEVAEFQRTSPFNARRRVREGGADMAVALLRALRRDE